MATNSSMQNDRVKVWDLGVRIFHWSLVASILIAFLSSEEDSMISNWHLAAGWVAAVLIVFRLVWGFTGGEHARFANFLKISEIGRHIRHLLSGSVKPSLGHNALGALAVIALIGLCAFVGLTGIQLETGGGEEDLHEVAAYALLGLIALHVVAVLAMSVLTHENLVTAMITGTKKSARHPGAKAAAKPGLVGVAFTILMLAATIFAVLQFDPQAFSVHNPGRDEATEYRSTDTIKPELRDNHGDED